ncbi:MAG: hypothetical protein J0M33_23945 [Anaerolineae bacterium]|jgi:hypothetical protein|nr:hypothetical protein [Anaerolineae bacterium]
MTDVNYTPTQAELDAMHGNLVSLNQSGEGVTADKLRTFYPKTGWNVIFGQLYALRDAGRVEVIRKPSGKTQVEVFKPL